MFGVLEFVYKEMEQVVSWKRIQAFDKKIYYNEKEIN